MSKPIVAALLAVLSSTACLDADVADVSEPLVRADRGYMIINADTGQCVTVPGTVDYNGTELTQSICDFTRNQRWGARAAGPLGSDGLQMYTSFPSGVSANGQCLGVNPNGKLALWQCDGNARMLWHRVFWAETPNLGASHLANTLRSVGANGQCADVPGGADTSGLGLQIYGCNGGTNQKWVFAQLP